MIRKLWTDEPPKTSGYYWFKREDGYVDIAHVFRGRAFTTHDRESVKVSDLTGVKWSAPIPFPSLHRANKHEARLKELTVAIVDYLAALDRVMSEPSSPERGSKVAKLSNALNFANDAAMHITLGMSFESMEALKRKRERERIKARKAAQG